MSAQRFRKKPVEVEAMQWTGSNRNALFDFTGGLFGRVHPEDRTDDPDQTGEIFVGANSVWVGVEDGEWIIHDSGGFYPCKPDIFEATYELAGEAS
ncbi:MAG: hypothetical protein WC054_02290 [Candidatus Nanopelagicales bacterium]